jgi:hypothetical protein
MRLPRASVSVKESTCASPSTTSPSPPPRSSATLDMGREQSMMCRGNDPSRLATKTTRRFPATTYKPYNRLCAVLQTLDSQCSGLRRSAPHRGSHLFAPIGISHLGTFLRWPGDVYTVDVGGSSPSSPTGPAQCLSEAIGWVQLIHRDRIDIK